MVMHGAHTAILSAVARLTLNGVILSRSASCLPQVTFEHNKFGYAALYMRAGSSLTLSGGATFVDDTGGEAAFILYGAA